MIDSISTVINNEIIGVICATSFVSILIDESTDVSSKSQMSTIIRFVDDEGCIQERFLGFSNVSEDRSAISIAKHVIDAIDKLDCVNKIVAQCYDGAAVMAGHLNGTQKRVKEKFSKAKFVHCFAHRLNLVLVDSVKHIKECKLFFLPQYLVHQVIFHIRQKEQMH